MAGGRELSEIEKRFCREYMIDGNASAAYVRAGYQTSGASARACASRLLTRANIREEIARLGEEERKKYEVTSDHVIRELARVGFFNLGDVIDGQSGKLREDVTRADMAALSGLQIERTSTLYGEEIRITVKPHDKLRALEMLGKHLGLFEGDGAREQMPTPVIVDDIREGQAS